MDAGKAIEALEGKIIEAVNGCGLHPAVVRLVLLNIVNAVLNQERKLADADQALKDGDANA